jgi:hypothetical protein
VYFYYEPPYFLLVAGLVVSILSGIAFEAVLKENVREWAKSRSTRTLANLQGFQLFLPFVGMTLGICLFLGSGIQIFGFSGKIAYFLSVPLTLLIAWLVWTQLGKILTQLEQGGSKALDLDSF